MDTITDGIYRTRDLSAMGISRTQVSRFVKRGELLHIGRGLYTTPTTPVMEAQSLAEVCKRVPRGVICLTSALQFHNLTTQNPWQICLLLETGIHEPRLPQFAIWVFRAGHEAYNAGVETHSINGVDIHVTCIAKTVADCFKYRNRIGLDIAMAALRECIRERRTTIAELNEYARICRVQQVMRPYIEAISESMSQ